MEKYDPPMFDRDPEVVAEGRCGGHRQRQRVEGDTNGKRREHRRHLLYTRAYFQDNKFGSHPRTSPSISSPIPSAPGDAADDPGHEEVRYYYYRKRQPRPARHLVERCTEDPRFHDIQRYMHFDAGRRWYVAVDTNIADPLVEPSHSRRGPRHARPLRRR